MLKEVTLLCLNLHRALSRWHTRSFVRWIRSDEPKNERWIRLPIKKIHRWWTTADHIETASNESIKMNPIKRTPSNEPHQTNPSNESHEANPIKNELQQFQQVRQLTSRQALVDSFKCFKCFKCFLQMRVRSSDLQIFSDHFRSFPITSDFFYNSTRFFYTQLCAPQGVAQDHQTKQPQRASQVITNHHSRSSMTTTDHHTFPHTVHPHHPHCV